MRKEEMDRLPAFERCMLDAIAKRKKAWIGHVVRGDGLLKLVIEGRMEGKRPRGRPRMGVIDYIVLGLYVYLKTRGLDRNVGWFGCRGPVMRQRTDDDDDDDCLK